MAPALPSGTVTFLFTDIEGSTKLLQHLGDTYATILGEHQALVRQAFAEHGGVEIDTAGDGFFVAFPTAPAAVAAAAAATRALAAHSWPQGVALLVRMGLHTGSPQLVGDRYVGLDVHRAARIAAAGHGGQILLSEATRGLAEHALPAGAALRDLGAHRLKDLQHAEHLYQLVLPDQPSDFPPLRSLDAHPHNLPVQPTPLLGREEVLAAVCARLQREEVRLVTVTGPAGIGKTRLALQVAAELINTFPDGIWFVRLSRLTDPALVVPTIAQTLGLFEAGSQPIAEALRARVADKHLLLVLDNFEQVVEAAGAMARLLESAPRLKLVVTSQMPLHLRGEREYPLVPLPLPDPAHMPPPDQLSQYAAVALFIERARDARPDFTATTANAPAIAEICARLDGLPLAIELAAARVKLLPPEALLGRLSSQLKLLTGGARDLEERQQTMRSAIAWTHDLLSPAEQMLFRRLAVCSGGCTLEAAEAICAAPEGTAPLELDPLDGLGSLIDKSLLQQREEGGEPRFGMFQVIREYALEQLEASGEADAASQAHFAYYLNLGDRFLQAEQSTWSTLEMQGWFARIGREHDNFRVALGWARKRAVEGRQSGGAGDRGAASALEAGLRLAGDLLWFWLTRGHLAEGRSWAETFLALDTTDPSETIAQPSEIAETDREALHVRARALHAVGLMARLQGDLDQARTALERSGALYRAIDDRWCISGNLANLGFIAETQDDLARATELYEESLAIGQAENGPLGGMDALTNLAALALTTGDLDLAQARSEEALSLSLQVGQFDDQASSLAVRALIACRRGQLERAAPSARKALELWWATGDVRRISEGLEVCAIVLTARGQAEGGREERAERAAQLLGAAAALRQRIGWRRQIGVPPREDVETAVAEAQETLGAERWATAYAAGQALLLEDAYVEALKVSFYSAILPDIVYTVANRRK
jgi:predicted ATPase/class 3 adenylate cyclase